MNDPIISPWLIWLYGLVGNLQFVLSVVGVLGTLGGFIYFFIGNADGDKDLMRFGKTSFRVGIPMLVFALMVPNQKTLLMMVAANSITPALVKETGQTVGEVREAVKSDVLELIQAIKEVD